MKKLLAMILMLGISLPALATEKKLSCTRHSPETKYHSQGEDRTAVYKFDTEAQTFESESAREPFDRVDINDSEIIGYFKGMGIHTENYQRMTA